MVKKTEPCPVCPEHQELRDLVKQNAIQYEAIQVGLKEIKDTQKELATEQKSCNERVTRVEEQVKGLKEQSEKHLRIKNKSSLLIGAAIVVGICGVLGMILDWFTQCEMVIVWTIPIWGWLIGLAIVILLAVNRLINLNTILPNLGKKKGEE